MPIFHKEGKLILFIHIPKAGGTFVEALFKRSGYDIEFLAHGKNRGYLNKVMHISPQHLHLDILKNIFDFSKFDFIFAIVRDPMDRFSSEFRMRHPKGGISINQWGQRVFNLYEKNPACLDNHIRPQVEFIDPSVCWYPLENQLDEAWIKSLNGQFDLGLVTHELSPKNKGVKHEAIGSENLILSPEMREQVHHFYQADYEKLGYLPHPR